MEMRFTPVALLILGIPACVGPLHHSHSSEVQQKVIRSLSFRGNKALDSKTLGISIATPTGSFYRRSPFLRWTGLGNEPPFNEIQFRRDVLRIQALYGVHG